MHVLVSGLNPSKELTKTFSSHGIRLSVEKNTHKLDVDLLVVRIKNEQDLKKAQRLKTLSPRAWLALVVGEPDLEDPDFYATAINFEQKDSVWHLETWESLIWFSIQEMTRTQALQKEISRTQMEVEESRKNTERLVKQIEKDLSVAERIQEKLVPARGPLVSGIQLVSKYIPAPGLGGDYFDIFEIQEGRQIGVLLVDSETHGMVAALLSILLKLKIDDFKKRFETPASFLEHLEQELGETTKNGIPQIHLFFGILDRKTLSLTYASNGSLQPFVWRHKKEVPMTPTLGETTLDLKPGDTLILSTNGLQKVLGGQKELNQILATLPEPIQLNHLKNILMGRIDAHIDQAKLSDDITFLEIGIDAKALVLMKA